jgi:putative transcriptional regulator
MKRDLFSELNEGLEALRQQRLGKITLRQHTVSIEPAPELNSDELVKLRQKLKLSQAVFASYLRTNKRTLENWEQGRAKPNAQATLLIKLVKKYPDTIKRLSAV